MADAIRALAERMNRSRTIGFVGAGYSARSGYPTWKSLIADLHRRASRYTDGLPDPDEPDTDLRWLAEMYANELMRHGSLTEALRESFGTALTGDDGVALDGMQLLVARLPFSHFITTNYDGLLEQATDSVFKVVEGREPSELERCFPRDGRIDSQFSDFLGSMADDRRSVLHVHGRLEGDQLTLSMGEYDKQYLHDAMLLRMFSIFATSTVVFIGASLYDADMMELLRRSTFHTNGRCRHFAFLPESRKRDQEMLRRSFGVEPIFYAVPAGDPSDHSDLERRLERLLELVEAERRDVADAGGNVTPVRADYGDGFDEVVEHVKDEIRATPKGPASFTMPRDRGIEGGGVAGSRVLRRVAADYRDLPTTYRFRHLVWLSPGRIGLFPGARARSVVDAILGEVIYSLGRHRATATVDRHQTIHAIRRILGEQRWNPQHEPALFVIDGSRELRQGAIDDEEGLISLLNTLPKESVAVYEAWDESPHENADDGDWPEPPDWARNDYAEALTDLFEDAADAGDAARADDTVLSGRAWAEHEQRMNDQRVLVALCIVATPISSDQLTTILEMDKHDVERTIVALRDRGLIESPSRPDQADRWIAVPYGEMPEPDAVDVGLLNPVRRTTLETLFSPPGPPKQVLIDVIGTILVWAERTIERLGRWEDDREQLDELIEHLPNLLAVFEAGCWIGSARHHLTTASANLHLWLGTDLAYVLYSVGRWAETGHISRYLLDHSDAVTEPETFRREVLVLLAAFYGHAGRPGSDFLLAARQADDAIRLADEALTRGQPEEADVVDVTYAPARLTPQRQKARAQLWRSHALVRILAHAEDAKLAQLLDPATEEGKRYEGVEADLIAICDRHFDAETQPEQDESLRIVADASLVLGEFRLIQRRAARVAQAGAPGDADSEQLRPLLLELDKGRAAASTISSRPRGFHAGLRGEVLLEYGNAAAARRCFARALLVAFEFRDRYLEATARLGLARCDRQASLADEAAEIFDDLGRQPEKKVAEHWSWNSSLERGSSPPMLRHHPKLIVIVGIPGSGKSAAVAAASTALGSWGFDPVRPHFAPRLLERIRDEEELDLSKVSTELADLHPGGTGDSSRRVVIVKIPTGRLSDLFTAWVQKPVQMRSMLCIHLHASENVLRARNEQRRSGQIPAARLDRMIEAEDVQSPTQTEQSSSWETWFQCNKSAYVSIDSEMSITEFEHRVRDALSLSYLPVETLLDAYRRHFE